MDIDAAIGRRIQHRLRQDPPIGNHRANIRLQGLQLLHSGAVTEVFRLKHRDFMLQRHLLDRGSHQLHASALGAVRLGIDTNHFKAVR